MFAATTEKRVSGTFAFFVLWDTAEDAEEEGLLLLLAADPPFRPTTSR